MQNLSPQQIKQFQKKILDWYQVNKRDLPWRQGRDPYRILISEVMLQQTQVSRVIPKYEAWLAAFPTVHDLASASVSSILVYWTGLGYNRRALNLKRTAEIIVRDYSGVFPQTESELLKLPGIGQYTARALLCFAFNQQIAVVDTNVRRVILTQFQISNVKFQISNKEIQSIADYLLPYGFAYDWNQALMDYAGSVLKKEKIAIPKQSKFIGSHRYYRGQVLKTLLEKKRVSLRELGALIRKDYEDKWLEGLVGELKDEGFVAVEEDIISLVS
jgi:A/G-specific adenine glycosylase